ncbi:MAG: hypothetical protein COW08_06210 [Ignavibacteriales bacterium CG12_big_fil_rev_8_21_14_0_65_30_8]|nr:MAG: hypothetical protein COW08_06210 [Ignavibacteriales bacterium CG12_big_fil_rev_8_21_14_0_65_30_8]
MNRKLKNTMGLILLLILVIAAGIVYNYIFQKNTIQEREAILAKLKAFNYQTSEITKQLEDLSQRANVLDSLLASRRFNIPYNLSSIKFFNFINNISSSFSPVTKLNVEYVDKLDEKDFTYYEYKITGNGEYNDIYKIIYSIEHSKELKKIKSITISNIVSADENKIPEFLVKTTIIADVYFAHNDRFSTKKLYENDLTALPQYDIFYPLIRNEIPPNNESLLDVQGAKLLALIPEGAFLSDVNGKTYLLWEGEQIYLGYLTKIDYENNIVKFIINKGGIIENITLTLEKETPLKPTQ